jgi:hypothetical protein
MDCRVTVSFETSRFDLTIHVVDTVSFVSHMACRESLIIYENSVRTAEKTQCISNTDVN